jgi:formyl-CoA transferase/CoA:oxalate CoA-transferase
MRVEHRRELEPLLERIFAARSSAEWMALLNEHGVPNGPVYRFSEIVHDPQVLARGAILTLRHPKAGAIRQFGPPFRCGEGRGPHAPPPMLGEHTQEVLLSLGYSAEKIDELRRAGVI